MNTAIIVATHKRAAFGLIEAVTMIFGEQENISCIEFPETDTVSDLIEKYQKAQETLETRDGILYLVDLFGGSPFNAACQLVATQKDCEVVSGVNMPMLLEILGSRESLTCHELANAGMAAAIEGVRKFEPNSSAGEEDE